MGEQQILFATSRNKLLVLNAGGVLGKIKNFRPITGRKLNFRYTT